VNPGVLLTPADITLAAVTALPDSPDSDVPAPNEGLIQDPPKPATMAAPTSLPAPRPRRALGWGPSWCIPPLFPPYS
jgi:hypothetical protein